MNSNQAGPQGPQESPAHQALAEQDVADFLVKTPGFFERHAELLAAVQLSHPYGGRAVSLQERQAEMLRDKIKALEFKIGEMVRHGQENASIADALHRWIQAMMRTTDAALLPVVMLHELRHQFLIPQAGLRLWGLDVEHAEADFAQAVSPDARSFTQSLLQPYCGVNQGFEAARWLESAYVGAADAGRAVSSLAMIPLSRSSAPGQAKQSFGMLVLGSPDPGRYTADMGTEFLSRVGDIASAALQRLLPQNHESSAG